MSVTLVQPYLNFEGRCEEALEFYRLHLGAEITMMMRMSDNPEPCPEGMMPPGTEKKIMHAAFRVGETTLMASDCRCSGEPKFQGISLSLSVSEAETADRVFAAFSEGGSVEMPLGKTFWSPRFGMVTDRFGISWMVNLCLPQPQP